MMKQNKTELIYLRTFICMLIVLIHIITNYTNDLHSSDLNQLKLTFYIQNIIIFATPSFIILSQLLTTLNYKQVTFRYLVSRFKYIFLPYLALGSFYSFSESLKLNNNFWDQFYENVILGHWYGYFIIVILQFFILSYLAYKITPKMFNSKWLLLLALVVQIVFLELLHNNQKFAEMFQHIYPLSENTFILGWIFFFFLGGYIGANYSKITAFLNDYLIIIIFLAIVSFLIFCLAFSHDYWTVTSFSHKLILYHTFMFLLLLGICLHFNDIMFYSVNLINSFSLFIYLLHPIILEQIYNYTSLFINYTIPFLAISLLFTLGLCIGVGVILREFHIFRFIIGKQPYKIDININ